MIKGKYIGIVTLRTTVSDEEEGDILPYEVIKCQWENLSATLKEILREGIDDEFIDISLEELDNEIAET